MDDAAQRPGHLTALALALEVGRLDAKTSLRPRYGVGYRVGLAVIAASTAR